MSTTSPVAEKRINKSAFVRNVLKEIGALTAKPPEGWRQKVEEALQAQNLKMSTVTIYQIRNKAMSGKKRKQHVENAVEAKATPIDGRRKSRKLESVSIADLKSLQVFATRFGGLDNLESMIALLKSIK